MALCTAATTRSKRANRNRAPLGHAVWLLGLAGALMSAPVALKCSGTRETGPAAAAKGCRLAGTAAATRAGGCTVRRSVLAHGGPASTACYLRQTMYFSMRTRSLAIA